jgi:hypothetical protein
MSSYLSRIVHRARGINNSNTVLPVSQSWPPQVNPEHSNPFEGEAGPEPAQSTQILPDTHTIQDTITDGQTGLNHTPLHTVKEKGGKNESLHPAKREEVQKQIEIAPVKPGVEGPVKPGVADPVKPAVVVPVLKKPGDTEESLSETGDETPITPVSTTKRIIHNQVLTQSIERMDNKRTMQEPVPPEPDIPGLETVRQSIVEPAVSRLSPGLSKNNNGKPVTAGVSTPVTELRPVSANTGSPEVFTPLKKENKEPRLVVGRIKVEVVNPQPVKTQPAVVRTVTKVKESFKTGNSRGFHSKMQFGLGQI